MEGNTIIAIVNQKGGVGKTTTTINLAAAMTQQGKRVCVIDLDQQCSLTMALGITPGQQADIGEHLRRTIAGYNPSPFDGLLTHPEGFDIMTGSMFLTPDVNNEINSSELGVYALQTYLNELRPYYHYILIDCLPGRTEILYNALTAADELIIPVIPESISSMGLEAIFNTAAQIQTMYNPNLRIMGILVTMTEFRRTSARVIHKKLQEVYPGVPMFRTTIPRRSAVADSALMGKSILSYSKRHDAAKAYQNLAQEVMNNGI